MNLLRSLLHETWLMSWPDDALGVTKTTGALGVSRTPAEFRGSEPHSYSGGTVAAKVPLTRRKARSRRSGDSEVMAGGAPTLPCDPSNARYGMSSASSFAGRALSRDAAGAWRVAGDPKDLPYSTLDDARIAAQFMGRRVA